MGSPLTLIKGKLSDFCSIIADVVRADAEIIGADFTRISGTGELNGNNTIMSGGFLYGQVFENKNYVVVQSPRWHHACAVCPHKTRCLIALEAAFPIFFGGEVIGAIGILCVDYATKNTFLGNVGNNLNFLRVMCGLIEKELDAVFELEHIRKKLAVYADDFADSDGFGFIIDAQSTILNINKNAAAFFGAECVGSTFLLEHESGKTFVTINGKQAQLIGVTVRERDGFVIIRAEDAGENTESLAKKIRPLEEIERQAIETAIGIFGSDTAGKKRAAETLGIGTATLYRKIGEKQQGV
ncbi:MAG: hypothetical protein LBM16_02605 [Clostridiales bacterium]|jgi:hypothetical protein|nr:hypothetical protein [Clostridiales bacterium]